MTFYFVYSGKRGSNLECALALYEIARSLKIDPQLILSSDNERAEKVKSLYPEARFVNFYSILEVLKLKKELDGQLAFFTMYSPKIIPLFLLLKSKKIFYFHATYDYSFSKKKISDYFSDFFQDILIKNSTATFATQWPLAWQICIRLGKEAEEFPHPPYSSIRKGFFDEETRVDLPFNDYFLTFGGLDRPSKGTEVLLKAIKGTNLNTIFAGKCKQLPKDKNIVHLNRWVSDGELYYLIKNCKSVVLPYLVPSQFSGCLALAFYFRKPILAPFLPTFEHLIEEDKTGWFFSSGNPDSLRNKMEKIWTGRAQFDTHAIAAKEKEMNEATKNKLKELAERFGEP